jgi:hypothetical protein
MQRLTTPLQRELKDQGLVGAKSSKITSNVARWTVLGNLRRFPDRATMMKLANEMFGGIELNILTVAAWREWPRRYNYHQTIIPYMKFLCLTDEVP